MDDFSGLGSGVLVAIAALLWLVYLVPSWFKKRQFEATERNAVRLQQTLRVLAETAEVPSTIRAEATARSAAEQERIMRHQERERAARTRAVEVAAARAARDAAREARASAPTSAQRLRRTRLATTLVLAAASVVFLAQLPAAFTSGIAGGTALTMALSFVVAAAALGMLGRLNAVARSRSAVVPTAVAPIARRVTMSAPAEAAPAAAERDWSPVPVPKPLYLSRPTVPAVPRVADDELAAAARASEQALRDAHSAPEVASMPAPAPVEAAAPERAAAPSRFAAMGRIDDAELGSTDLDEVLRRRRAAS